jgi:hypothetical protein
MKNWLNILLMLSLACLSFWMPCALAQPEEPPQPAKIESILEDLYGNQEELDQACKQPCQKEEHILVPHPSNGAYRIEFKGIYTIPFSEGSVNGLDMSKRVRIPDHPLLPKEERENIRIRMEIFVMDGRTWMTASRCNDGCQCVPLLDNNGRYRRDPNRQPTIGMHEVLLHAGTFEENGKRYLKQYILKAYTLRIPYLAECRAGYCGPRPF